MHWFLWTTIAATCLLSGCGKKDAGLTRYEVSGQITYQGQPVPAGAIQFYPDSVQGNRGPTGYATIENGTFDTSKSGRGTVGGPHVLDITGFDGKADPQADLEHGQVLFGGHKVNVDLPREKFVLDIAVPATK